jgi:hypothetical protein
LIGGFFFYIIILIGGGIVMVGVVWLFGSEAVGGALVSQITVLTDQKKKRKKQVWELSRSKARSNKSTGCFWYFLD